MRIQRRAVVFAVALLVVLSGGEALAAPDLLDPNDTKGPLDVRRVYQVGGEHPIWRIATGARWRARAMFDRGYVLVYLDTFGRPRADYYALVWSTGSRMTGMLVRDRAHGHRDRARGRLPVWRRNRRSVTVRVRLEDLFIGKSRTKFRWHVRTTLIKKRCPSSACIERAPNKGAVENSLPV